MSIKEWVKSPRNSLSGWDDRSLIVCPLFEINFLKNIYEKKKRKERKENDNMKFPGMVMVHWQCFKCEKPSLQDWDILYVVML